MFQKGSVIIEGATEKVLQFMIPLKTTYKLNFGFYVQKGNF
jgi:hypothetical protein